MPLDGAFLFLLKNELNESAVGCRVEKIYQPSKEELVFVLRSRNSTGKLLISAKASSARVHFTKYAPENPATPPMFCMLLRKYLTGAKITGFAQPGLERVLEIQFESVNEMGDIIYPKIVAELIGSRPNIIFVAEDGRIQDAVRRSDMEKESRLIQPGATYQLPEPQNKLNILNEDIEKITSKIKSLGDIELSKAILSVADGLSPLICREITHFVGRGQELYAGQLDDDLLNRLNVRLKILAEEIAGKGIPTLILNADARPMDFTYISITQYGTAAATRQMETYSELLDEFYAEREHIDRIRKHSSDLLKLLTNLIQRVNRKINAQKADLARCKDREKCRIYGELINANLYNIQKGQPSVQVQNYYDPGLETIRIPLDTKLSPAQNAQKYFKEYRKLATAEHTLKNIIKESEQELEYLESVFDALTRADTVAELAAIEEELVSSGYIKTRKKNNQKVKSLPYKKYLSSDGFTILVGRNNRQNDELTLKTARKDDIWLHTKSIPGSHVIIRCEGKTPPDSTIKEAAILAAYNSKARDSSSVPVDYTLVKNVKKPPGAKPGMVIYDSYSTAFVKPDKSVDERLSAD
ncbi:MAG TPA: fibronectin/fibrinogen-binding protein [Clostridiales bacterium]|nr:fibronectin/fibrinogen-binding protein [Clostridiales bacterium]